ncbi:NAD(P)/FAD-dependent oxidoreductase [Streptomyces sp. NBC_00078]|uniref:NAD(P)/FAD-dependent oxidoreductase n=1 Tax=unclassified Streptomyces TaxID=2593676 RepID=UPI00225B2F7C|nr:tryptophan 7-halogenase [Streptomyces sp. NBC_00078]MCX5424780.1 tryptophan 7-halogenase [Streptomyces sp. NBC_00078]
MNRSSNDPAGEQATETVDVAILGGGIAGLTLALQLKQSMPDLAVTVIERQAHPVAEAAHKVGESSVEMQAHYLRDVLGLKDHLESEQLRKFGLRMFFPHNGNHDIARRVEFGQIEEAPLPTYQLDRGRLENHLGTRAIAEGVRFLDNHRVIRVDLRGGEEQHLIEVSGGSKHQFIQARWVVDASGRASLLKRQQQLAKPSSHHANSSWLRVAHPIDIGSWSNAPDWRARTEVERGPYGRRGGARRLSTNHLMGHGYWVWLIPLASGSTSIGIVADADIHPYDGFNTLDRALEWLRNHEPQCAAAVDAHRDKIQDFRVMRDYAYGCKQVYSEDRWCLTGEAGVSIDPLYSSGGDLMGISNGLIVDLIERDRAGDDIREKAVAHNQVYLVLSEIWLAAYEQQYPLMGNPQVMVAKVIWDTIMYWSVPGLLFFHGKFPRLGDSPQSLANLFRAWKIHNRVQQFAREWHAVDDRPAEGVFADPYTLLPFIVDLHEGMAAGLPDDQLDEQFAKNVTLLEQVAGQLVTTVIDQLRETPELSAGPQIEAWLADPLLTELRARHQQMQEANPIDSAWITLGRQSPSMA